jgi:hypothetical protein
VFGLPDVRREKGRFVGAARSFSARISYMVLGREFCFGSCGFASKQADLCASRHRREEPNPSAGQTLTRVSNALSHGVLYITESGQRAKPAPSG